MAVSVINCNELALRTAFSDFINTAKNLTDGDFTKLEPCRPEVCAALWGTGNHGKL
jgi:hypothetical protein